MDTAYDYSRGQVFVHEGYMYYSPNCSRPVAIPPRKDTVDYPFTGTALSASDFRQPVWWSDQLSWLAFTPLQPTFTSLPFEPFSWMPPIESFQISVRMNSEAESLQTRFQMREDVARIWKQREQQLEEVALKLRLKHNISFASPPLPSTFGFMRTHRSYNSARKSIINSRNWFGVLMGWLAGILAETEASRYKKLCTNSPHPYWYRFLLDEGVPQAWLDGLYSSPVCNFSCDVLRAGIVIAWAEDNSNRPSIDFFYHRHIPLFFPWTAKEEEIISRNPSLSYLRPPNELIQNALSFLTSSPSGLPLAAYTMNCFFGTEHEQPLKKEALSILQTRHASSFVLKLMISQFLKEYNNMKVVDKWPNTTAQILRAMVEIPIQQRRIADAAVALPQQDMLRRESRTSSKLLSNWKDFFRLRTKRSKELLNSASAIQKQTFDDRARRPPTKNTTIFIWEVIESPSAMTLYTRNRIEKSGFADLLDGDDPRIYDPITNQWDFFPDFVEDHQLDGEGEDGVPSIHLAPPSTGFQEGDDDSDGGSYTPQDYPAQPEAEPSLNPPRPPQGMPLDSNQRSSFNIQLSSSYKIIEDGELQENPDISVDMEETLRLMYGWQCSYGARFSAPSNALDWRGVEKVLGFTSPPAAHENEKSAITAFVSTLARGFSLPSDLDDLNEKNRTALIHLYDFRNVFRLENLYIFHSPPSTAVDWVIGVSSAEIALYIVRIILSNRRHTIYNVACFLLERGVQFHTLLYLRSAPSIPHQLIPTPPIPDALRTTRYTFTRADYESSMLSCKTLLNTEIGRAALLQGGILARIAREFISFDAVFDGPSPRAVRDCRGYRVKSETAGYEYWDDALTDEEVSIVCGSYTLYTDHGLQTTTVSWFPPPSVWAENGFGWSEWTETSETFFKKHLLAIQNNKFQPLNRNSWRSRVRGMGGTRGLLKANKLRSDGFMDQYCPARKV